MTPFTLPPKKKGVSGERFENTRSMVIVGANGCGKSRMGAFIEKHTGWKVHRITAQRALSIPPYVQPRSYDQAESTLLYGHYDPNQNPEQRGANKFAHRWGDEPASRMLSDFDSLLALLFADEAKRNRDYSRKALTTIPKEMPPKCKLDTLAEIWKKVMPQRLLTIFDDKIDATTASGSKYEARHMSDGERVTVYLMGQTLCAPKDGIIIIDEPEIHLHRAIQGLLWDELENARQDCTFIYITHDLDFAATRTIARKIWVEDFDGNNWTWKEVVAGAALPDALLLQVLGSRRPALFVEGDDTSYDVAVYSSLYPNELVIPRENCTKVIEAVKSLTDLPEFHNLSVRGIVDRDRRGTDEVTALQASGILVADVAEIENLLCLPAALTAVATQLKVSDVTHSVTTAQAAVIAEMTNNMDRQALARALNEVQFRLNGFGPRIRASDAVQLGMDLTTYLASLDVQSVVKACRKLFEDASSAGDYIATLRLYNSKGIISLIAGSFGIKREVYSQMVLSLIKSEPMSPLAKTMRQAIEGKSVPNNTPPTSVSQTGNATASTS